MSVTYVCERAPQLKIRLGRTKFCFSNKQLTLEDADVVLMDEAIANSVHVRQLVKKVNIAEAEAVALAHKKQVRDQAVKGAFSSESLKASGLQERDAALAESQGLATREDVLAVQQDAAPDIDAEVMLTEGAKDSVSPSQVESRVGFVPAVTAEALLAAKQGAAHTENVSSAQTKQVESADKASAINTLLNK